MMMKVQLKITFIYTGLCLKRFVALDVVAIVV